MKHKLLLFLAIVLVFGDISYLLVDHFVSSLDYLIPLLAINAVFSLFTAFSFFFVSNTLHFRNKLPLPVSMQVPTQQFSDQLLIRHFPDLLCLKDQDGRWLSASPEYLASFNLQGVDYFGKTDFELAQHD
ncbi:MAG: hypothetical protein LUQ57_02070, partial [Methylococcaceae bacterium]|nr:hypothetical protein [Methylococcaceae bacterium]